MTELAYVELDDGFGCYTPSTYNEGFSEVQFIYKEIFGSRSYLDHGIELKPDARVVDIGANVGLFTLFVKRECPDAQVVAFEPVPAIHAALSRNVEVHGLAGVSTHRSAVGDRTDEVGLTYYPSLPGNSTRYPDDKAYLRTMFEGFFGAEEAARLFVAEEVTAPVEPLSALLRRSGFGEGPIDLVKIDVEGAEPEVLRGIDAADWPRVAQFVIEVQDQHGRLASVRSLLEEQGFTVDVPVAPDMPAEAKSFLVYATRP